MVERYAREKIKELWTEEAKFNAWLKVEKSIVKAWGKLGLIPADDVKKIQGASFKISEINELEKELKHDVLAFLGSVSNSLGEESRWIHYGVTSSDIIDTANALMMKDSLQIIDENLQELLSTLRQLAYKHQYTLMVGRTHGIHGEPITFGLVLALWFDEIKRHLDGFNFSRSYVMVGKISGAMGNMPHSCVELEEMVCDELGLNVAAVSNQIIQRDRYARLFSDIALLSSSCEKIALAIRHFQRSEVNEVKEYFSSAQRGSSAMPHKQNPVLSENITGLCRVLRSYVIPALENVALWHERDISHSAVERFILPDAFITLDFMLVRLNNLLKNMEVSSENMRNNLNLSGGLVFSQRILLELPKRGVDKQKAYLIVQRNAKKVWEYLQGGGGRAQFSDEKLRNGGLFLKYLKEDEELKEYIDNVELESYFEYEYYMKNVDAIFKRVFKDQS